MLRSAGAALRTAQRASGARALSSSAPRFAEEAAQEQGKKVRN